MGDPNKYIKNMILGQFPGDDGATLYNLIIKLQFEREFEEEPRRRKANSLEKEMAIHGFHIDPNTEITQGKNEITYFDPKTRELEFEWDDERYLLCWIQIHEKGSFCLLGNGEVIVLKKEENIIPYLNKIIT